MVFFVHQELETAASATTLIVGTSGTQVYVNYNPGIGATTAAGEGMS